jgi:hypothetical protein
MDQEGFWSVSDRETYTLGGNTESIDTIFVNTIMEIIRLMSECK